MSKGEEKGDTHSHHKSHGNIALALTASDVTSRRRINRAAFAGDIARLSILRPWKNVRDISIQWLTIVCALAIAIWLDRWYLYLVCALIIATRQHALGVLVHEAVHYRMHPNRWWNDFLSDVFCALPISICTSTYRFYHFRHHQNVNTDQDPDWTLGVGHPDWTWPKPMFGCLGVFARDLMGINFRMILGYLLRWSPYPRLFWASSQPSAAAPRLSVRERITTIAFAATLLLFVSARPTAVGDSGG